ncbi:MAG TPA: hemerythrin domain-containing protein [Spirochaetia bacterium]|nr:hemerythrin domain-containing protein [Spirochaetia bacterium]
MKSTGKLKHEHQAVLKALEILEKIGRAMEAGQPYNLDHVRQIMTFLTVFVDQCHHGKEEKVLFPALEKAGVPPKGGPVGVMLMEHDQGRGYIRGMQSAVDALAGGHPEEAASFVTNAGAYAALLRQHIAKEDNVLYPMADRLFSPGLDNTIAEEFQRIEEDEIGAGRHEEFDQMLHHLEHVYL